MTKFDFSMFSTPEMVATCMTSVRNNGPRSGRFGEVSTFPLGKPGTWKVTLAGNRGVFLLRNVKGFWHVQKAVYENGYIHPDRGMVGVDVDIEEATYLAIHP